MMTSTAKAARWRGVSQAIRSCRAASEPRAAISVIVSKNASENWRLTRGGRCSDELESTLLLPLSGFGAIPAGASLTSSILAGLREDRRSPVVSRDGHHDRRSR